jgi:hypothetical protein
LPFDELTPEERVRQSEKEKLRLAAKAREDAIKGNTVNTDLIKTTYEMLQLIQNILLQ